MTTKHTCPLCRLPVLVIDGNMDEHLNKVSLPCIESGLSYQGAIRRERRRLAYHRRHPSIDDIRERVERYVIAPRQQTQPWHPSAMTIFREAA